MLNKESGLSILWDFDGTLFDTYPAYASIFKQVLNDEKISEESIYKQLKVSFRHASEFFNITEEQLNDFHLYEQRLPINEIKPFEGVEEILKYAQKNVIMTHKPRKEVLNIVGYYNWGKYFVDIVAGDDGFPRKPNPESYEYLHKKHTINLVIGDRELDIIPGKKLGITTCLFQNKQSDMAEFYLDDYRDFFNVILNRTF